MNTIDPRLDRIRGAVAARNHNARTIAALTSNPGCARRAILDAAGIDKQRLAAYVGFPARFGQSQFALTRGNVFEAQVKANGCAELLQLLRDQLGLPIPEVSYDDLEAVGANQRRELRHARTRRLFARAAAHRQDAGTLFDHPMLRITVAGQTVYLEPDLVAFQLHGRFHVVEIKSFAVIDGQADGTKVAAAATQSAVYVLALRELLAELGYGPETVAYHGVLVCPKDFTNRPTATLVDLRKPLTVLKRQLSRLTHIEKLLDYLPLGLTLDLCDNDSGVPQRSTDDVLVALNGIEARYAPECLASCEMAYLCRHQASGRTASLGRAVCDDLGGIDNMATVVGLAKGTLTPSDAQAEAAQLLQLAARLRHECLGDAA